MALHSESERRIRRIRALAIQLEEQTLLNTARSRSRCRDLAQEILALIAAEEQFAQRAADLDDGVAARHHRRRTA